MYSYIYISVFLFLFRLSRVHIETEHDFFIMNSNVKCLILLIIIKRLRTYSRTYSSLFISISFNVYVETDSLFFRKKKSY